MLALMVDLVMNARFVGLPCIQRSLAVVAAGILIVGSLGFWSGNLLGHLPPYEIDRETINVMDSIRSEPSDYRMLHLPMTGPASYTSGSGTQSAPGNNPFVTQPPKPTIWLAPEPTLYPQFFSTVFHALLDPAHYPIHNLLNFGRVELAVLDPHWQSRFAEFIRSDGRPWLADFERPERLSTAIDRQSGLEMDSDLSDGPVQVLRVRGVPSPKLAVAETVIAGSPSLRHLVTGWYFFESDRAITHLHDLSRNSSSAEAAITETWFDDDIGDLAFSYIGPPYSVEPATRIGLNSSRASIDWVANYLNAAWYLNSAISDATRSVVTDANFSKYEFLLRSHSDRDELWVRYFESPYGGNLRFDFDGQHVATIQSNVAARYGYRWSKIPIPAVVAGDHTLNRRKWTYRTERPFTGRARTGGCDPRSRTAGGSCARSSANSHCPFRS